MSQRVIAVVPTRVGNKHKGTWPLSGIPLVEWTVSNLMGLREITSIVITTDEKIEDVLPNERIRRRVQFVERPMHLRAGKAGMHVDSVLHAVERLDPQPRDVILLAQPTSPFVFHSTIRQAINALATGAYASVQSVHPAPHNYHPLNARRVSNREVDFLNRAGRSKAQTKQDKEPVWYFGNLVATLYDELRNTKDFFAPQCCPVIVSRLSAWDIDCLQDLEMAQELVPLFYSRRGCNESTSVGG